jgi:hypothetical protein
LLCFFSLSIRDYFYRITVFTPTFVQRSAFTFVLGVGFFFVGASVFEGQASAQFRVTDKFPAVSQPILPAPDQHQQPVTQPAQLSTPAIPAKVEPSTPLVEQASPRTDPNAPALSQTERNQLIERHAEQLKSGNCARKLEQRRRALRQQGHGGYRYPRQ